jgi:large subunit ribosomal protein L15
MKGFEGGQMPLHRRLPKVGFTNIFKKRYALLNLSSLERFKSGDVVDENILRDAGLVKGNYDGIKLLGEGEIKTSLTLKVDKASRSAVTKVEAAGGKVETV